MLFNDDILLDESVRILNNREIPLNKAEKRCLALLHAAHQFKNQISNQRFRILSEEDPLQYLNSITNPEITQTRWIAKLQKLNYIHDAVTNHAPIPMDTASALPPNAPEKPDLTSNISQIENLHLENPISQRTSIPFPITFIKNNEATTLHPITTFPSPPHPTKLPALNDLPPQRLADYTDLTSCIDVTDDIVNFILSRTLSS